MIENSKIGAVIRKVYPLGLTGREMNTLIHLLIWTNDFGYCDKTNEELAGKMNTSVRTVTESISSLKKRKIISVVQNSHQHKRLVYVRNLVQKSVKYQEEPPLEKMSAPQKLFKMAFPDKVVDCDVPSNVDMPKLIQQIASSDFLLNHATNMTLYSFCVKHYKLIMSGYYSSPKRNLGFSSGHNYTKAEMNALFQDVEDIEV